MKSLLAAVACLVALVLVPVAEATTVQGTLRYNHQLMTATFTAMADGGAFAYETTAESWLFGTVDIAANSYSIDGLTAGTYQITVRLSKGHVGQDNNAVAGDLVGYVSVTVTNEATIARDVDLLYAPRITQPLDGGMTWKGSCTECPKGAEVARSFTLAWEPVPAASSYKVTIRRFSCSAYLGTEVKTTSATSVQVDQQTVADETYILVDVDGFIGQYQLTAHPYIALDDCWWQTHAFHSSTSAAGRQLHMTGTSFLAQVAHLAGQPPSFWKTDLFLTNPTAAAVTVKLRYTPRDVDGTQTYSEAEVALPAGASRTITDVLDTTFQTSGAGSLEVEPSTVEAACRNYTPGAGPGLYGQGFLPIAADQIVWLGGPSQRLGTGGVAKGPYRANLALTEVWGEQVEVVVSLLDRDGVQVGEKAVTLQGFGTTQLNDVVGQLGGPATISEAQVVVDVTSGGGRVGAVLSLVDNASQDPSTLPLTRR